MNEASLNVKVKTRETLREKLSTTADKAREFLRERFPDIPAEKDPLVEAAEVAASSLILFGGVAATYVLFAITLP